MNNTSVKTMKLTDRHQAIAAAVASVQAEGLQPSTTTLHRLQQYASGAISAEQLRTETLSDVRNRTAK